MIFELACLRLKLLRRQKIFWLGLGLALAVVLLSFLFANISFVKPQKIFWDFSLAGNFLLQTFLAIFLGAFLFQDERDKRTLHWVLSLNVSRAQWLGGNFLGLGVALSGLTLFSTLVMFLFSFFYEGRPATALVLQTIALGLVETWVVLALAMLVAFFVRPLLALGFTGILVFFLHSQDSLRRILLDPVSGRFVENQGLSLLLYLGKLLPPLQWMDLRELVGYQGALAALPFLGIFATGLGWGLVLLLLAKLRFERLDL